MGRAVGPIVNPTDRPWPFLCCAILSDPSLIPSRNVYGGASQFSSNVIAVGKSRLVLLRLMLAPSGMPAVTGNETLSTFRQGFCAPSRQAARTVKNLVRPERVCGPVLRYCPSQQTAMMYFEQRGVPLKKRFTAHGNLGFGRATHGR